MSASEELLGYTAAEKDLPLNLEAAMTRSQKFLALCVSVFLFSGITACNKQNQAAGISGNPADGNLAQVAQSDYPPSSGASYSGGSYQSPAPSYEQLAESPEAPPPLPEYSQPPCPGENYAWTPGYWAYSNAGFYWVPGAWVLAPWVGALWTPPWWGYDNGVYVLYAGYWGPHIGFYGGIDYGFGYPGRGYYGAYWNQGRMSYNIAVTNVDRGRISDTYRFAVPTYERSRVSYNAGRGGIHAAPTPQEMAVARDPRTPALAAQTQHAREASTSRAQSAAAGMPAALAVNRPLATNYRSPAARPPAEAMRAVARRTEVRPSMPLNERVGEAPGPRPASQQPQVAAPSERRLFEQRPVVAAGRAEQNRPQNGQRSTPPIPFRNPTIPPSGQPLPPPVIQRPATGQHARNIPAERSQFNPEARAPQEQRAPERPITPNRIMTQPHVQSAPHPQSRTRVMQQARSQAHVQASAPHPAPQAQRPQEQRQHAASPQEKRKQ